jgi:hypothetical protein
MFAGGAVEPHSTRVQARFIEVASALQLKPKGQDVVESGDPTVCPSGWNAVGVGTPICHYYSRAKLLMSRRYTVLGCNRTCKCIQIRLGLQALHGLLQLHTQ